MFAFVVCFLWMVCSGAALEYLPLEQHHLHNPYQVEYAHDYDNYEPSDYHFQYAVSDPHTGDHKSQWEVKEKGVVRGMYSLLEPDGTTRVVEYIADDHGFRATVKKLGTPIETHHHHGGEVLLSLPEAYNGGYSGAYSGLGENYGIASYATPIDLGHQIASVDVGHQVAPINLGHQIAPINLGHQIAPIDLGHHRTSVEVHGFTGNADDDSSYTNYDDEGGRGDGAAIYYRTDGDNQHNYYQAQPPIISVPYKLAYQYQNPYAYIGRSYNGY